jgi:hypothetical protein
LNYEGEIHAGGIRLSLQKMRENHGGPFGAVIVCDGKICRARLTG